MLIISEASTEGIASAEGIISGSKDDKSELSQTDLSDFEAKGELNPKITTDDKNVEVVRRKIPTKKKGM